MGYIGLGDYTMKTIRVNLKLVPKRYRLGVVDFCMNVLQASDFSGQLAGKDPHIIVKWEE